MGANRDDWIAAAASYIRNSFGHSAGFVTAADVARVRAATASRKTPWTVAEIEAALPRMLDAQPSWRATASHNTADAPRALTLAGWTSGAPQQAGMWFQVELPAPVALDGNSVRLGEHGPARRSRRRRGRDAVARRATPAQQAAAALAVSGSSARLPRAGVDGRQQVERAGRRGQGRARADRDRVLAGPGEVHPDHGDRRGPGAPAWSIMNLRLFEGGQQR